jgi:CHAD domain-containing protein
MAKPLKIRKISPDDRKEKAARRILRTRIKEYYSCWPDPDHPPTLEQLHNLRISGKRLRYSAESLRELYPDRLALLIDLLKRSQDLLGEIQDCVTQRGMIEAYIARMRRRAPKNGQIPALERMVSEYEQTQSMLFTQFHETWRGMAMGEFRASLKALVSRVKKTKGSFSVDQTGDKARAEPVVNVDHSDV